MKKFKIILLLLLIPFIVYGIYSVQNNNSFTDTVQAFGNLTATYLGVPLGQPIFNVVNMFPGSPSQTRTVKVKNDAKNTTQIYVSGIRKGPIGQTDPKLETILNFEISEGTKIIYSDKLSKFFDDSIGKKGIRLDNIQKGQTKDFDFKVTFPSSAKNAYQNKSVVFDITFSDNNGDVKGDHDENKDEDSHDYKDDHKRDFRDDFRDFGNKCRSVFDKFFKFGKR